jgi:hypothetical protein
MPGLSKALFAGAALCALVTVGALAQGQTSLPEGAGKELVEGVCTACHQTNQITRSSGYSREGWRELTSTMIDLSGDPDTRDAITQYLAAAQGYTEEKMEVGAKSSSALGVSSAQQGGVSLDTMVQRLVQKSVWEIDSKYK